MVSIFVLALTKEAILLDYDLQSKSENHQRSKEKQKEESVSVTITDTQRIQQSAGLQRSHNNFCTIDGLFCVPANYSK